MELICLGLSHQNAPVEIREKLSLSPTLLNDAHLWFKENVHITETVILSTCNRIEFYALIQPNHDFIQTINQLYLGFNKSPSLDFSLLQLKRDNETIKHLFRVVSGLDSMVVGETEIFGQVKEAYSIANSHQNVGKTLHRLFQMAFRTAKQVRNNTDITRGSVSVGSIAVELACQIFGDLEHKQVVLLGAGDTIEKTARALISRGIKTVIVANRTYDHAVALAQELGGKAVPFDNWHEEFKQADIVISSTSAPHMLITHEKFKSLLGSRINRPLFLIDLAVPRDIDPDLAMIDDVYLYNIDDLRNIADKHLEERRASILKAEEIIDQYTETFLKWRHTQKQFIETIADSKLQPQ